MEQEKFKRKLETLSYGEITKELLRNFNFHIDTKGECIFMEEYIYDKYKEIATKEEIKDIIDNMINQGLITITNKRTIFNSKWVVNKLITINYEKVIGGKSVIDYKMDKHLKIKNGFLLRQICHILRELSTNEDITKQLKLYDGNFNKILIESLDLMENIDKNYKRK